MSDDSKTAQSGGIGLCGALFLVFVVLRLTDHIDWAWYWIAAPLWMPLALVLALFIVTFPIFVIADARRDRKRREQKNWL